MTATTTTPTRLLLVDDHPVVREGIRAVLAAEPHIEVVGEAADGAEAIRQAQALAPDVILMDISMPAMNGIEATAALKRLVPQAKVVALTIHDSSEYIVQILKAGAYGYVLKDAAPAELRRAVESAAGGEPFFSPSVSKILLAKYVKEPAKPSTGSLSARESEILVLIAQGKSNRDIAAHLGISVRTVETHRARIMRKLGIRSVAGLTKYAISQRMIGMP